MSGFFDRLAQRARGEATVVQPRVESLFAPLESRSPAAEIPLAQETVAATRPSAPPPDTAPAPVRKTVGHAPSPSAAPDATVPVATTHPALFDRGPAPQDIAVPTAPPLVTSRVIDGAPRSAATTADAVAEPVREEPPRRHSAIAVVPARRELLVPRSRPQGNGAAPPPVEARATPEPPAREPAVHITIGRVDVRTQAPERSPRPAPARPQATQSLGDYLARDGRRP